MKLTQNWLLAAAILLRSAAAFSQNKDPQFDNNVWLDDIRTVELKGPDKLPFVPLRGSFVLHFDLLGEEPATFLYQIIHCNADWTPSKLQEQEYLEGFSENRLRDYEVSVFADQKYAHYALPLPNADVKWTVSGNYLLKVYLDDDERTLALTRRFIVYEDVWQIGIQAVVPAQVSKMQTCHELDFSINQKSARPVNPREAWATVLENGRWDNALTGLHERTVTADGLNFDYQDSIVFPAGKEFRYFDISTFDYRTERVERIALGGKWPEVWLRPDIVTGDSPALNQEDNGGEYQIFFQNTGSRFGGANKPQVQADYALVHFRLKRNAPTESGDVYLFGGLTDWQVQPQFKCVYDEKEHAYTGEAYLKQGYYNYEYVVVDPKTGKLDHSETEGNWFATTTRYTVVAYWRPHGQRYDRVMGLRTITTSKI